MYRKLWSLNVQFSFSYYLISLSPNYDSRTSKDLKMLLLFLEQFETPDERLSRLRCFSYQLPSDNRCILVLSDYDSAKLFYVLLSSSALCSDFQI